MKTIKLNKPVGFYQADSEWLKEELASANGDDIKLEISSPGGFVFDGIDMFNQLKNYSGKVHTHLTGLAASMASYLALAGERITAESNAVYMIHNPSSSLYSADYRDAEKYADYMRGLTALMAKTYAKRTGKTEKEIRKLMDEESFFFGDEMKAAGFVDEMIELEKRESKDDALAYAKLSIEDCSAKMKGLDKYKEDLNKVAAVLKIEPENKIEDQTVKVIIETDIINTQNKKAQIPAVAGDNKNGGVKIMNLDELKAQHPALYNEVFNLGKKAGKDEMSVNIQAHAKWFKADPEAVMSAIEKGEEFTMAHLSTYTQSQLVKNAVKERMEENPGEINPADDKTKAQSYLENFEKSLMGDNKEVNNA